jgi:hypothetical protein
LRWTSGQQKRTCERAPLDWAWTQEKLGNALATLGERESGTARLEEAAAAYRDALQEYTRARRSIGPRSRWDVGDALRALGEQGNGTARLEEAVSALRETLQEWTRARVPHYWAMSTGNQGVALMLLAEWRGDAEMATLAAQQIEAAFTTRRDGGDAHSTAMFEAELPKAQALVRKLATR